MVGRGVSPMAYGRPTGHARPGGDVAHVPSHELGADLWSLIEARVGHIIGIAQRRASDALIERHLHEVLENLPHPITGEGLLNALRPVVEFTTLEIRRPGVTDGVAQEKLAMFDNLLKGLTQLLPAAEQHAFSKGAAKLVAEVAAAEPSY